MSRIKIVAGSLFRLLVHLPSELRIASDNIRSLDTQKGIIIRLCLSDGTPPENIAFREHSFIHKYSLFEYLRSVLFYLFLY